MSAKRGDEFRCSCCGGVFDRERDDDAALAEARDKFGDLPQSELCIVCDDCWKRMGFQ